MLHGNAATHRADTVDILWRNRFRMVDEPVQPVERHLAVDRLVDIERPLYRFVVGRVQAERPAVLRKQPDDLGQTLFHAARHIRTRLEKNPQSRRRKKTSNSPAPLCLK